MPRIFIILFLYLVMGTATAADNDCIKGVRMYVDGDYKKTAEFFLTKAEKGNACAQFQLGMMYYYGHGVKADKNKARQWIQKSAKGGFSKAKGQLDHLK